MYTSNLKTWGNILNALHFARSFVQGHLKRVMPSFYLYRRKNDLGDREGAENCLIPASAPSVEIYIYEGKIIDLAKTLWSTRSLPLWFRHQINFRSSFQGPSRWPNVLASTHSTLPNPCLMISSAVGLPGSSPASWYKDGSMASW